jgi:CheY-like chemotaxis protein
MPLLSCICALNFPIGDTAEASRRSARSLYARNPGEDKAQLAIPHQYSNTKVRPSTKAGGRMSNSEQNWVGRHNILTPDNPLGPCRTRMKSTKEVHVSPRSVSCIFVVDDEAVIAASLAAILQMNGFSAKFFTCPLEALAAARSESPDLIISDVAMPGISGIDLAIQMRAQHPGCKVLLFSGQATTSDLLEGAGAHGYDFRLLQKPVHPSEFLIEIGQFSAGLLQLPN